MSRKIALVGHCGPDSSYLRMAVLKAMPGAEIYSADDDHELTELLGVGMDLLLFNRELGYGFDEKRGVEAIKTLHKRLPHVRMMLVSNYPDAQAAAVANGAQPGFGKREIGSAKVLEAIQSALEPEVKAG